MDVLTFIGWTLLIYGAYKVGVYVEHKMQARKAQALQAQADPPELDSERK